MTDWVTFWIFITLCGLLMTVQHKVLGDRGVFFSSLLQLALPLLVKSVKIILHVLMALFSNLPCDSGIHPIFQEQQLFIEMINAWSFTLKVRIFALMQHRIFS